MNTQRFQIGDVVRIIETTSHNQRYFGVICTVTSDLVEHDGELVHVLDIEPSPGYRGVCAPPHALELVYDGRRRASWSDCAWRPRYCAGVPLHPREQLPMKYHVTTTPFADGRIVQLIEYEHLSIRETVMRQVMNTAEQQIRDALIALGWTPPAQEKAASPADEKNRD